MNVFFMTYSNFCFIFQVPVDMGSFLKWLTGKSIPPLAFGKQFMMRFVHGCQDNCKCRPTVLPRLFLLNLPLHINNEDEMKDMVHSSVNDSKGFGLI